MSLDQQHLDSIAKDICVPFIAGILAIAVPLITQTIGAIDTKYSSTRLVKEFYKENTYRNSIYVLITSLICVLLWLLKIPRVFDLGILNGIVENSSLSLLVIATIVLIIYLFRLVKLITIYYDPEKLLIRLKKDYSNIESFQAISELLYFSINQENQPLERELETFISECCTDFRKNKPNEVIVYPDKFYDLIFEANERICLHKKKSLSTYINSTQLYIFFDGYNNTIISDNTYSTIWRCLRQQIEYGEEEMIVNYWVFAHQHFELNLHQINQVYNNSYEVTNQKEIDKREHERERFLEFHYALGGFLMYKCKFKLLGRLIKYTSSSPARYCLVPETMTDVINRFMKIKEPIIDPWHFLRRYPFPENVGVNRDGTIRMWMKKYVGVLFLRQYTLNNNYYGGSRLSFPNLPINLSVLNFWEQELVNLRRYVDEIQENKLLLTEIGFPEFKDQWFETNNKPKPLDLINEIINITKKKFDEIKTTQPVSKEKEEQFKEITKDTVLNAIKPYKLISNKNEFESEKTWFLNGVRQIVDKTAFTDNQDIGYLYFDSSYANLVATNYKLGISETFYSIPKKTYLLERNEIFDAIDKLKISPEEFIIVTFGVNFSDYLQSNTQGLTKNKEEEDNYKYKNVEIVNFQTCQTPLVGNTFFILKLDDLPLIKHNKANEKFKLDELDKETHLSAKVFDLYKENDIRKLIEDEHNSKDFKKSALVCIELNTEIRWKENINCFCLKVYSQFWDRGTPNKLEDVNEWESE